MPPALEAPESQPLDPQEVPLLSGFLFLFFFNLEFINKSRSFFPPFSPPTLKKYIYIYMCVCIVNSTSRGSLTKWVLKSWTESGFISVCFEMASTGSQGELG